MNISYKYIFGILTVLIAVIVFMAMLITNPSEDDYITFLVEAESISKHANNIESQLNSPKDPLEVWKKWWKDNKMGPIYVVKPSYHKNYYIFSIYEVNEELAKKRFVRSRNSGGDVKHIGILGRFVRYN